MNHLYLIALDLEVARSATDTDLATVVSDHFPDVRVVERGYAGQSVTLEVSAAQLKTVLKVLPPVTVELARDMDLLEG